VNLSVVENPIDVGVVAKTIEQLLCEPHVELTRRILSRVYAAYDQHLGFLITRARGVGVGNVEAPDVETLLGNVADLCDRRSWMKLEVSVANVGAVARVGLASARSNMDLVMPL